MRLNCDQILKLALDAKTYHDFPFFERMKDPALRATAKLEKNCKGCSGTTKEKIHEAICFAFVGLAVAESQKECSKLAELATRLRAKLSLPAAEPVELEYLKNGQPKVLTL